MRIEQILRAGACLFLSIQLMTAAPVTAQAAPDWPSDTGIQAEIGIVMDMDSDTVLFGQGIHVLSPPASITKLLTALVVVENSGMDDMVTFSHDAVYNVESGSGNKYSIEEGDVLSVRDCLYLMVLQSSNQAANALAEHVAGSRDAFVDMMNERISSLGMADGTHFSNPSGLNDDEQLVSAYDMARISKAVFENPQVLEIASAKTYTMGPTINNPDGATFGPESQLLKTTDPESEYYYPQAKAGKTGYTSLAGNTLVTYAEEDGRRLISVILKGKKGPYYLDTKALLTFGFDRFQNVSIADYETRYVTGDEPFEAEGQSYEPSKLEIEPGRGMTLPKNSEFSDAVMELETDLPDGHPDRAVALLRYTYNERKIGEAYLLVKEEALPETSASQEEIETVLEETEAQTQTAEDGQEDAVPAGNSEPSQASGAGIPAPVLVLALLLCAAGIGCAYISYARKREAEELRLRRERRMERMKNEEEREEFLRLLEEKKKKEKR